MSRSMVVVALWVIGVFGLPAAALEDPDVVVTAKQLAADYAADKKAADEKYGGKVIRISGEVIATGENENTAIYADLVGVKNVKVRCHFPEALEDQVKALKKGAKITVQGYNNSGLKGDAVWIDFSGFVE